MAGATAQIAAARLRPALTKRFASRVDAGFRGLADRLVPRIRPGLARLVDAAAKADGDQVDVLVRTYSWDAEARRFLEILRPMYDVVGEEGVAAVGTELGLDLSYDLVARETILEDAATQIRLVDETSQQRIANLIGDGIDKGLSIEQIVSGVREGTSNVRGPVPAFPGIRGLVDSWLSTSTRPIPGILGPGGGVGSRSYLVALTETANAWNTSAIAAYDEAGIRFVEVFDGPSCGWSSHNDPDLAHGSIRTLDAARARPLAHPRCQRAFGASIRATGASRSPFAGRKPTEVPGASPGVAAINAAFREAGDLAAARAARAEPGISAALRRVRSDVGATFEGYDFRLKKPIRIAEKASADAAELGLSVDEASSGIRDALRYTYNWSDDAYAAGVQSTIDQLAEEGITLATKADGTTRFKNFWLDDGYQGINAIFRDASGYEFELQFGTFDQAALKEASHRLYEELRVLDSSTARAKELEQAIIDLWAPIHENVPPGVDGLSF